VPSSLGVHVAVPMLHAFTAPESVRHAQNEHAAGKGLQVCATEELPLCVTMSQNSLAVWHVGPASPQVNETGLDCVPQPSMKSKKSDRSSIGPRIPRAPAPKLDFAKWIVFEDAWLLAVDKPAGVLSQGGEGGEGINVVDLARAHLKKPSVLVRGFAPDTPRRSPPATLRSASVGVLHRIDRNVSGVVLIAKDHGIASAMTKLFASGAVERVYRAIVRGSPTKDAFTIDAWLKKNERTNEVEARATEAPGFRPAKTEVRVLRRLGEKTELEVRPITGRSHQIRVHLAFVNLPIIGDPKYGVVEKGTNRPLLHAERVTFVHPRTRKRVTIEAPIPWII